MGKWINAQDQRTGAAPAAFRAECLRLSDEVATRVRGSAALRAECLWLSEDVHDRPAAPPPSVRTLFCTPKNLIKIHDQRFIFERIA